MNSRFFKLCCVYSNLPKMSNVGVFPWSWFLGDLTHVLRERKIPRRLFTPYLTREIRHFHVVVVQWRQRNVPTKHNARAKLLYCLSKPIAFSTFSLLSLPAFLKLPTFLNNVTCAIASPSDWSVRMKETILQELFTLQTQKRRLLVIFPPGIKST